MKTKKELREKLQEFRASQNLSQSKMAEKIKLSESMYKCIEYGYRDPSFNTLKAIKTAFPFANIDEIFLS